MSSSTFQQYNIYDGLTAVRVVSTSNVAGTYSNGPVNNGVGAQLVVAASSLTVDSVVLLVADRVLLVGQSSANQNGIYVVESIGATVVLQRSADFQNIEQLRTGQFVTVKAGTLGAGAIYTLVEPKPAVMGVSNMVWVAVPGAGSAAGKAASNPALSSVASVSGTTTLGGVAVFADTAGTVSQNPLYFRAQRATGAGGSATVTVTDANVTTASIVLAQFNTSANAVTVQKVTAGSGTITVLCSADPGANTLDYISVGVPQ